MNVSRILRFVVIKNASISQGGIVVRRNVHVGFHEIQMVHAKVRKSVGRSAGRKWDPRP
jgi:hypothetical protein